MPLGELNELWDKTVFFIHFHVNDAFMVEGILTIDKARGFPLLLEGLASFKVHVTGRDLKAQLPHQG